MTPKDLRQLCRNGLWTAPTAGVCDGFVQCNIVAMPAAYAADFARFCQQNPKPCPVIAQSNPGQIAIPRLGNEDIRSDCPQYKVFSYGQVSAEPDNIIDYWQDDWVFFALGCSFSFEESLLAAGVPVRHIEEGSNVPMYNTTIQCEPAGQFQGDMVVSMRPMTPAQTIRAIQVCSRFPSVHGAPVHFGDPSAIGIRDIATPDYGDAVKINSGELPVFWACGVTPQRALVEAKIPIAATHAPGHMLVTDLLNSELAVL
jgi:uncharacterized protein YcsI (UPF0317 family)